MELKDDAAKCYELQSYIKKPMIEGVRFLPLKRFNDDGGNLTELARLHKGGLEAAAGFVAAQINYTELQPGTIKAFHIHREQTDVWYVPPGDKILLVLIDVRKDSISCGQRMRIVLGDGNSQQVFIPPGVAHGCRNISGKDARIIYFMDRHFSVDTKECDEGRLPWDFAGTDIWEIERG